MSNPDSFIDEVTEEVRRDRLFRLFRKYGWIGVVLILGLVGGTAWTEWSKSRDAARAQAFGDSVIDALDQGAPVERREALEAVPSDAEQTALLNLILATDPAEDKAATLAALEKVSADATLAPAYRDAPPPVEMKVISLETPALATAATESPPPTTTVAPAFAADERALASDIVPFAYVGTSKIPASHQ